MTADQVFQLVSAAIPATWQITALKGYVIMYDDSPNTYGSAWRYYREGQLISAAPEAELAGDVEVDPPTLDE